MESTIPGITVHLHASGEGGIFANAYLVETPNGVVAIDGTLTVTESRAFRARVDALKKPLLGCSSRTRIRITSRGSRPW